MAVPDLLASGTASGREGGAGGGPSVPPTEYEYRYPHRSFDRREIVRLAAAAGGGRPTRQLLVNRIFHAPPGSGAAVVRLREVHRGRGRRAEFLLTVKWGGGYGSRAFEREVETAVADAVAAEQALLALGCRPKHVIEKLRDVVDVPGLGEVAFDENPGLPCAMEVEATSRGRLARLVRALGLRPPTDAERLSGRLENQYAELYGIDPERTGFWGPAAAPAGRRAAQPPQPALTFEAVRAWPALAARDGALLASRAAAQRAAARALRARGSRGPGVPAR